jgi:hypothetical protein
VDGGWPVGRSAWHTQGVQDLLAAMMISDSDRTVLPTVIAGAARFQ